VGDEAVMTVYGAYPRDAYPMSVTGYLSALWADSSAHGVLADQCTG
jgi:hypothetical protein